MEKRVLILGYDAKMIDFFLNSNYYVDSILDYYDVLDGVEHVKKNESRYFVDDATNASEVVNKLMEVLPLDYLYSNVITRYEGTIITAAIVKELFTSKRSIALGSCIYRNKVLQKKILKGTVPTTDYKVLKTFDKIENNELEFPIICKPKSGQGSVSTLLIKNKDELTKTLNNFWNNKILEVLIEKVIEGEEYHVDGWVKENEVGRYLISKYNEPVLNTINNSTLSSVQINNNDFLYGKVKSILEKIINLFKISSGVFHMEFFKTKKGELIFSEIAMRPGGGKIIKTFELKTTVNLINMLCSLEIEQKKTMKLSDGNDQVYGFSFLPFPQKNFSKKELTNDLKELFKDIVSIDIEWDETGYPTIVDNSYTRFGQIVVKGNTSESVDSILDKILKYYGEKYL